MKDITSRDDIRLLVDTFYGKVMLDPLLEPVFRPIDLPGHLPAIYNFWATVLLGDRSYLGNPFQKHMALVITPAHFNQWLALFTATVDENFTGEVANEAKNRAVTIAQIFQQKMGLL